MLNQKVVALVAAAAIAIAPCLSACGNDGMGATPVDDTDATTEAETPDASSEIDDTEDASALSSLAAEGKTDDNAFNVYYLEARSADGDTKVATLVIEDIATGLAASFSGDVVEEDGRCTLTDTVSGNALSYSIEDMGAEANDIKMTIDERGPATLVTDDAATVTENITDVLSGKHVPDSTEVPDGIVAGIEAAAGAASDALGGVAAGVNAVTTEDVQ